MVTSARYLVIKCTWFLAYSSTTLEDWVASIADILKSLMARDNPYLFSYNCLICTTALINQGRKRVWS